MKKILALMLAAVMLFAVLAACGEPEIPYVPSDPTAPAVDPATPDDPATPAEPAPEPINNTLTVGYGVAATGDFIEGWGNSAYDMSMKILMHGYKQGFMITEEGDLVKNPAVLKDFTTDLDADGNKTYTFTLQEDLLWSDGTPMTAKDYVAQYLWCQAPAFMEVGGWSGFGQYLLGTDEYLDGENEYYEGVQLLGEYQYALTIRAEELPNFSEFVMVSADPLPLHSYFPGINIISDENGAKFDGDITADAERISSSGGERFAPTVVAGPYTFVSFTNNIVTLQRNDNFKGDHLGRKPSIEFIQQIEVSDATDVDQLFAGEVDYLPEEIIGAKIERVKAESGFTHHSFLRNGFGLMNFECSWGPTADRNVRWAIACLVDRNALLEQVLEGYGGLVDTEAGEAQWMYQMKRAQLQETLIPINLSIDRANEYLDETDWRFEEDGRTPFDASKANTDGSYMRHNNRGEMLVINHGAANAEIGAVIEIEFLRNTPLAGIQYNFEYPDWDTILDQFYFGFLLPDSERHFSTFSMGTGFNVPFDPYTASWHSDFLDDWVNSNNLSDPELDDLIITLIRTEPGDNATYLERWFDYVVRWNYLLPALPLYSNEYFDLFNDRVQGVNTTPFASWYQDICALSLVG